jgi:1,4-alpha-glucan branching enzyme
MHRCLQTWVADLNGLYRSSPALYEQDFIPEGFEWIDAADVENSVVSFLRKGREPNSWLLVVCNFTPVPRQEYRIGVPRGGLWQELLNSDAKLYGGSGHGNLGSVDADPVPFHNRPQSLLLVLPPLSVLIFKAPKARNHHNLLPPTGGYLSRLLHWKEQGRPQARLAPDEGAPLLQI